jgi:integrase
LVGGGEALAAVAAAHRAAGHAFDAKHRDLVAVWSGIRRQIGVRPDRKSAVLPDDLRAMLASLDRTTVAGQRDAALLLIGFGAALRRSELVALDVQDVTVTKDGVKLMIKRSKTDQEGAGTEIAIMRGRTSERCPVVAIQTWLTVSGILEGPLFRRVRKNGAVGDERLTDRSVADTVKQTRHKSVDVAKTYVRDADLWRNNGSALVL